MIHQSYIELVNELIANYRTEEIKRQAKSLSEFTPIELQPEENQQAHKSITSYIDFIERLKAQAVYEAEKRNDVYIYHNVFEFQMQFEGKTYDIEAEIYNEITESNEAWHTQPYCEASTDISVKISINEVEIV
jgi:hypothetical protein